MAVTDNVENSQASASIGDSLGRFLSGLAQLGLRGLVPLARVYVGAAGARLEQKDHKEGDSPGDDDMRILGLAAMKLAFEAGDLSYRNPTLSGDLPLPAFALDARGYAPDFSIAHVLALRRLWTETRAKAAPPPEVEVLTPRIDARAYRTAMRTSRYSATVPEAPAMAASFSTTTRSRSTSTSSTSRSCCGGSHTSSPAPAPRAAAPRAPARSAPADACGCGGGCSTGATTKTYGDCPTLRISCETKAKLRDCVKTAVCDLLRTVADAYCPDGKFDPERMSKSTKTDLYQGFGQLVCSLAHCVPEALCPPEPCPPALPPGDYLPCDYAVEVTK
jgi:hypothetical protein